MKTGYRGKGKFAEPENPFSPDEPGIRGKGHEKVVVSVDEDSDRPDWAMGNNELNPHSRGGGQPDGAGDMKGDLYGDLYVILRDTDPTDGGGNGEPVLDDLDHEILIGSDGSLIEKTVDGDIPEYALDLVQEVEFSRLSVARSPASVMEHALEEALTKLAAPDATVSLDGAGRLVVDGSTIDSPLENLALYQELMTTPQDEWSEVAPLPDDFDVAALLGAASDKTTEITVDTLIYENTILGINEVGTGEIDYFDFTTFYGEDEAYDYIRSEKYTEDVTVTYYRPTIENPTLLEPVTEPILLAVFGGVDWGGEYEDETPNIPDPTDVGGVDDFVQAADDARAVIDFLHNEIVVDAVSAEMLLM